LHRLVTSRETTSKRDRERKDLPRSNIINVYLVASSVVKAIPPRGVEECSWLRVACIAALSLSRAKIYGRKVASARLDNVNGIVRAPSELVTVLRCLAGLGKGVHVAKTTSEGKLATS
jgi:hypothetical protein